MDPGDKQRAVEFGRQLRVERERSRVTQDELARRMGYADKSAISRIEKGQPARPPSRDQVARYAEALDTNPRALMVAAGHPDSQPIADMARTEIASLRVSIDRLVTILDEAERRLEKEEARPDDEERE